MREVIRAENSGFCFGVKQAIEKTEEQVKLNKEGKRIFCPTRRKTKEKAKDRII